MPKRAVQLNSALREHRSGNLTRASEMYQKILRGNPRDAEALHLLGLISSEQGAHELAIALIGSAIEAAGPIPVYCANLGRVFGRQGRHPEAIACYRQTLLSEPANVDIWLQLARAFTSAARIQEAAVAYERAVSLDPTCAEAFFELANLLYRSGLYERAVESYTSAASLWPRHAEVHYNLGVALSCSGRTADAIVCYRRAVQLRPDYAEAHNNLGTLLQAEHRLTEAEQEYRLALKSAPGFVWPQYNLGRSLEDQDRSYEALDVYSALVARSPNHADAHNNLGNTLLAIGECENAVRHYRTALTIDPKHAEAHWNLGLALLKAGEYEEGWREYEWRFDQPRAQRREFDVPLWDGAPLHGRPILIHAEQGLGDTLQFIRFLPLVKERGGHVILECQPPLEAVLERFTGYDALVGRGKPVGHFTCHAPLMSVPRIIGNTLTSLPADVPYLQIDPELVAGWGDAIQASLDREGDLRVGLTWGGNAQHRNDRYRSLPASYLEPLGGVKGVSFFGLQKGRNDLGYAGQPPMIFLEDSKTDLLDTAAILLNLDLVISVDTSMVHLAGALGRPTWVLLSFNNDWRWLMKRQDSPWYPNVRLFRQSRLHDWYTVINHVHRELSELVRIR